MSDANAAMASGSDQVPPQEPAAPAVNDAAQQQQSAQEGSGQEAKPETEEQRKSRSARRLDRWKQRAFEAEARLKAFEAQQPQQRQQQVPQDDSPKREQYATYEEFLKADATYHATKAAEKAAREALEKERNAQSESRQRAMQEKAISEWNAKLDDARDEIEDFDDVLRDSDIECTPAMTAAIMESDVGAKLAYYLAKHPDEAERIAKLKPSRQAAAIVALEEKAAKPSKAPSKAPAPINPVQGKDSAAADISSDDPRSDKLSTDEWMRRERARMEKKGIRV